MTEPIISINDLSVYFNKKKALNNVTMDFYPNEITALIGPSGSGKSTLLRSINRMGDLNPEWTLTGAVSYNGHNVYSPRTDTVELVKKSEWSSNNPILFLCLSMKTWFMGFVSMVSKIRLSLTKQ